MDLEITILSEVSQRITNTIRDHLHVESKIWHKRTYVQNRNRFTDREQTCGCQGGGRGSGVVEELGVNRSKLLLLE